MDDQRPPLPPFSLESAAQKVQLAEDGWNSQNPEKVALAYTPDCRWRNRNKFITGREEIISFLTHKWNTEHEYRLVKELWAYTDNRIAVRFAYEYHDSSGQWFRAHGNENWQFNSAGIMEWRVASINDQKIAETERLITFAGNKKPEDFSSLSDLGL